MRENGARCYLLRSWDMLIVTIPQNVQKVRNGNYPDGFSAPLQTFGYALTVVPFANRAEGGGIRCAPLFNFLETGRGSSANRIAAEDAPDNAKADSAIRLMCVRPNGGTVVFEYTESRELHYWKIITAFSGKNAHGTRVGTVR